MPETDEAAEINKIKGLSLRLKEMEIKEKKGKTGRENIGVSFEILG